MRHHAQRLCILMLFASAACQPALEMDQPTSATMPPAAVSREALTWSAFEEGLQDLSLFKADLVPEEVATLEVLQDATRYIIDLTIAEDLIHLNGKQRVEYVNREDVALEDIVLRLFPNLAGGQAAISELHVNGMETKVVLEPGNSAARVPLPTPLEPGEGLTLEMDFLVELPTEMAGNYGLFGSFDNILALQEFYPLIPVYDDEGWNAKIPPEHGDLTYLDASFYLVRVTAPAGWTLVASGLETERSTRDGAQVVTFAAGPVRDFYLAASDRFQVVSRTFDGTRINSYTLPEYKESAQDALMIARDALKVFNRRLGPYPYTEFDIVSMPMQALGMEYPGATAISTALYDTEATISGLPSRIILESTLAHEVAHQWFYNVVGSDQVDEPWVDEAVTQYATWLYYVDQYGADGGQGFRDSWFGRWDHVERETIPIGRPSAAYDPTAYSSIVYGRGPLFIEALAKRMGQETFDAFLRTYYENHRWGVASGASFRQVAEAACQCDLSDLFEAWVYD